MQLQAGEDFEEEDIDAPAPSATADIAGVTTQSPASAQIGQRLDVFVTSILENGTRSEAQRLIEWRGEGQARATPQPERQEREEREKQEVQEVQEVREEAKAGEAREAREGVRVNGRYEKPNYRLRAGDVITVQRPAPKSTQVAAENIDLEIVYEDSDMLVINKPRGMVTHPAPGAEHGTLVNAVLGYARDLSGIGGEQRPGIVHRLDKDTGGLIMVAKNDVAHRALQAQIQARTASRRYKALLWGVPNFQRASIDAPIGRHPTDRKKMAVLTDARYTARAAQTELTLAQTFGMAGNTFALVEAKLQTGRTHQIRVHCAYIQHPIVGDPLYGGLRKIPAQAFPAALRAELERDIAALNGQALHAYALSFDQPRTGVRLHFETPLPPQMQTLLDHLNATD